MTDALLDVHGVSKTFGGLRALHDVEIAVPERSTSGLIGPNGAGKTTLFNVVTAFLQPDGGSVRFDGQELIGLAPHEIADRGLVRTFQRARPLHDLNVLENVMAGAFRRGRAGAVAAVLGTRSARIEEAATRHAAGRALEEVGLSGSEDVMPGELTAGQLRLLEIARVLASEPRLVLLDEPAAGLTRQETTALAEVIRTLPERGITCLLVEHDVELVFEVCEHVTVLDFGEVIARGTPSQVRRDPKVVRSYLGQAETDRSLDG